MSQFFMKFYFWCKSPGPIKDMDMIMKIWTDCDNYKYTLLVVLVWANTDFIEICCVCYRHVSFNLFHGSLIILLDTCTLFPKILPPSEGNIVGEVHKHNNKFYHAKIRNGSRVLYLGVFYEFAEGMDPYTAFLFWLCWGLWKRYNASHGWGMFCDSDIKWNVLQSWYNFTHSVECHTFSMLVENDYLV